MAAGKKLLDAKKAGLRQRPEPANARRGKTIRCESAPMQLRDESQNLLMHPADVNEVSLSCVLGWPILGRVSGLGPEEQKL